MAYLTESVVEESALARIEALGYRVLYGPEIAVGQPNAERRDRNYRDVVLERRLGHNLFPKLISGELRVKDAEQIVEREV